MWCTAKHKVLNVQAIQRKCKKKAELLKCLFAWIHLQKWFNFSQELRRQTQWLCAKAIISCLLCSCWFTGLITQPATGKPGSDCLRERALPWTLDKLLAVKHCLFPVTGSSGFVTAPSCYLSSGQNVASIPSPLYLPALWSWQRPLVPRRIGHLKIPWMVFASLEVWNCYLLWIKDFPHHIPASRAGAPEQKTGSLQTRPCCFSDHLTRP